MLNIEEEPHSLSFDPIPEALSLIVLEHDCYFIQQSVKGLFYGLLEFGPVLIVQFEFIDLLREDSGDLILPCIYREDPIPDPIDLSLILLLLDEFLALFMDLIGGPTTSDKEKDEKKKSSRILDTYDLIKFQRTNQKTGITQEPIVRVGQPVREGQVLADGPSMDRGELGLGKKILVAFMP